MEHNMTTTPSSFREFFTPCNKCIQAYDHVIFDDLFLAYIDVYYLVPIFATLGIVGNLFSFMALACTNLKKLSPFIFVAGMTLSDLLYLLSIVGFIFIKLGKFMPNELGDHGYSIFQFVMQVTETMSPWFMVAFMLDRYIYVVWHVPAMTLCTSSRARCFSVIIAIMACALNTYVLLDAYTDVSQDILKWIRLAHILLQHLIPIFIVMILGGLIIKNLQDHTLLRRSHGMQDQYHAEKVTRMLVICTVIIVIFLIPYSVLNTYANIEVLLDSDWNVDSRELEIGGGITWMLYNIKFAVNILIFSLAARTFRKALKDVICCRVTCCKRRQEAADDDCMEEVLESQENIAPAQEHKEAPPTVTTEL